MKEDRFNQLVALLSGNLKENEKDHLLEEIAKDPEDLRLLSALDLAPVPDNTPIQDFPFPVSTLFRLGIHEGSLKVIDLMGLDLEAGFQKIALAASRITTDALPFCVEGRLDLRFETPSMRGELSVEADPTEKDAFKLRIVPDEEAGLSGYVEIWRDGVLQSACPGSLISKEVIAGFPTSGIWALKPSDSPFGMGFRIRPVSFQVKDWMSVCLNNALVGRFSESKSILEKRVQPLIGEWTRHQNILGILDSFKSIVSAKGGILIPIPAMRAAPASLETRKTVLKSVWDGILAHWPDADTIANPWSSEERRGLGQGDEGVPEGVAGLAHATVLAATDPGPVSRSDFEDEDREIRAGWAALIGWDAVLRGDYRAGFEAFTSTNSFENDFFGLRAASAFANHLMESKNKTETDPILSDTSDQVMKELFKTLLES